MKKQLINYQTLLQITTAISQSKDPEEVLRLTVQSIKNALDVKGCALFLIHHQTQELEVAASFGISDAYLSQGDLVFSQSMPTIYEDGPIAIADISDDPRIQDPEAAKTEGIASILSAPIVVNGNLLGYLRVYTAEPYEFTPDDVNFVQAVALISGILMIMNRQYQGLKESIDILKGMRDPKYLKFKRRTPYEGVPESILK